MKIIKVYPNDNSSLTFTLRPVILFFFGVVFIGVLSTILNASSIQQVGTSVMWMLACLIFGAAGGFLFGIPKIFQKNGYATPQVDDSRQEDQYQYQQQVNSNLTEISDWLTKIIVGLGLINLTKFPPYLYSIANTLASGLNEKEPKSSLALAYAIIIGFSLLGFLFGYIATRLFLAGAFSRADQQALSRLQMNLESTQAQLSSLETNQSLINQSLYSNKRKATVGNNANAEGEPAKMNGFALEKLEEMANHYLKITHPDWGERVRLKDNAANEMADFALQNKIKKEDILSLADKTGNEGLILALAMVINVLPEADDFEKLMKVAPRVSRLHVRYRVLVAISKLFKLGFARRAEDKQKAVDLINRIYRQNADQSLMNAINSTLSLINTTEIPVAE